MPPPDFYSISLQRCPILSAFLRNCQVVLMLLVWGPHCENQLPQISHNTAKCSRIKWRNMPSASEGYAALKMAMPGRVDDQRPDNYRAHLSQCYGISQSSPSVLERVTWLWDLTEHMAVFEESLESTRTQGLMGRTKVHWAQYSIEGKLNVTL